MSSNIRLLKKKTGGVSSWVADERDAEDGSGGADLKWLECLLLLCSGQSIKTIPPLDKCEGGGQRKWAGRGQKRLTYPEGREKRA